MKVEIKVPTVGESIVSGILTRWIKKNGESAAEGEPLFELETDKVNIEVPSPAGGTVETLVNEGEEVRIGQTVGYVDTLIKSESVKKEEEIKKEEPEKIKSETVLKTEQPEEIGAFKTSPSVRRIAGENNINLDEIEGTGKGGRITGADLLKKINAGSETKKDTVVKMSPIRKTIARNLVQAKQEAAHLTTFNEINMEHVVGIRTRYKDDFMRKYGIKLGFMPFFVKACCRALMDFPDVNSMIRGDEIVYHHYYNIGVAVAVDEGLIVPVIRDADTLTFPQIEMKIDELAQKARIRKITLDDLQGGTFTITNGGIFGSMLSTPIPSYPQSAILGMHSIKDRAWVVDGRIEIKPVMYVALTYDHRIIDGKDAVEFLVAVKQHLEDPDRLLIEL